MPEYVNDAAMCTVPCALPAVSSLPLMLLPEKLPADWSSKSKVRSGWMGVRPLVSSPILKVELGWHGVVIPKFAFVKE